MFDRFRIGWQLTKQSWRVLMLDKELLLFPLMSGIACMFVMASFAVPLWASGVMEAVAQQQANGQEELSQFHQILGFVLTFAFYVVNYTVIIFFNSALIACAIIRFKGGDPTISQGLSAAFARLPQILAWAVVAATVGIILKAIESRSERVGAFIAGLLGMAWSVVTFFVVPVIVVEQAGPLTAGRRSFSVLRKTWGEALSANFGIGIVVLVVSLISFIPLVLGIIAVGSDMVVLGIVGIAIGVLALLIVSLVSSTLNSIIVGALYLYAAEEKVPQEFDADLMRHAFSHK